MRPTSLLRGLLAALGLLAAGAASAQSPSAAAGYVTFSLPATAADRTQYFTPPLLPAAEYTGTVAGVTAAGITIARTDWTAISWTSAPAYLLLTGGAQAGRLLRITANTDSTLTLDPTDESAQLTALNLAGFAVAAGDAFEIIPAYTLGTFFGATTADQTLSPGATPAEADLVSLWNWKLNRFEAFYFSTQAGTWLNEAGARAADTVIPPTAMLAVTRRAGRGAVSLVLLGRVPKIAPLVKTPGAGFARYSGLRVPVALPFSQLVLGSNWIKSNSAFTADTLSIFNQAAGLWEAYYQRPDGGWRKNGSTAAQDATVIPSGAAVVFLKRMSATGATSFQTVTLPYIP